MTTETRLRLRWVKWGDEWWLAPVIASGVIGGCAILARTFWGFVGGLVLPWLITLLVRLFHFEVYFTCPAGKGRGRK